MYVNLYTYHRHHYRKKEEAKRNVLIVPLGIFVIYIYFLSSLLQPFVALLLSRFNVMSQSIRANVIAWNENGCTSGSRMKILLFYICMASVKVVNWWKLFFCIPNYSFHFASHLSGETCIDKKNNLCKTVWMDERWHPFCVLSYYKLFSAFLLWIGNKKESALIQSNNDLWKIYF